MSDATLPPNLPPATGLPGSLSRRAWLAGGAMVLAAVAAERLRPVPVPRAAAFRLDTLLPRQFGAWRTDEVAELLVRPTTPGDKVYGIYDQVLERIYVAPDRRPVMLSIAWGSEQSVGLQAHRPEVCYPSAGYVVRDLRREPAVVGGTPITVTRMHARLGPRSEPVSYWMLLGDQPVADDAAWRWRQLRHGLQGRILDGLLVRVSTIDAEGPRAWGEHLRFADELLAALPPEGRTLLLGRA